MLSSSDSASGAEQPPGDPPVGKNEAKFPAYETKSKINFFLGKLH